MKNPNVTAAWIAKNWGDALRLSCVALKTYKVPIKAQDREDAIHEAFVSLISIDALKNYMYSSADGQMMIHPNNTWFGTMVARKVLTWLRDQGVDPVSHRYTGGRTVMQRKMGAFLIPERVPPRDFMALSELLHDIHACLDRNIQSPERHHEILNLKFQGWTVDEMAKAYNVSFCRMNNIMAKIRWRLRTSAYAEAYPEILKDDAESASMGMVKPPWSFQ